MLQLGNDRNSLNVDSDQVASLTYAGNLAEAVLSIIKYPLIDGLFVQLNTYHYLNVDVASWYGFQKKFSSSTRFSVG